MAKFTFQKASKEQTYLRAALFGPSGSGKTFTSLRIATGMGGRIALIDTERRSASKYADRFTFDTLDLPERDIETYCEALESAAEAGYNIVVVDSLTHGWHELLEEVDSIAKARYGGNTWGAWSEGTPKQRRLVSALLDYPGHVLATMRSKTEWTSQTDKQGKVRPVRVGLSPEQGKGIEYEFDLLLELSTEHTAAVLKDRTGKFQDQTITKPDEKFGEALAAWLSDGAPKQPTVSDLTTQLKRARKAAQERGCTVTEMTAKQVKEMSLSQLADAIAATEALMPETTGQAN